MSSTELRGVHSEMGLEQLTTSMADRISQSVNQLLTVILRVCDAQKCLFSADLIGSDRL